MIEVMIDKYCFWQSEKGSPYLFGFSSYLYFKEIYFKPLGWLETGGVLSINWMESKPAPDAVLEFASCKCKKIKCSNKQCKCKSLGLPCTDLCECVNCENEPIASEEQKDDEIVGDDEGMNDDVIDTDDVLDEGDEEFIL